MHTMRAYDPNGGRHSACGALLLAVLMACGGDQQPPHPDTVAGATTGPVAAAPPAAPAGVGAGAGLYQRCAACHQANGERLPGVFPPLAGSEWVTTTAPAVPIRIVLHGM